MSSRDVDISEIGKRAGSGPSLQRTKNGLLGPKAALNCGGDRTSEKGPLPVVGALRIDEVHFNAILEELTDLSCGAEGNPRHVAAL